MGIATDFEPMGIVAPNYVDSVNCPEFAYLYQLRDPRDLRVRYVGCCSNPYWTMMRHRSVTTGKQQPNLKAWIRELRELGLRPQFRVLQKVLYREGHRMETNYIRSYEESLPGQLLNVVQKRTTEEDNLRSKMKRIRKRKRA